MRPWFNRLMLLWEQLQVELHGQYSVERLHCVDDYSSTFSCLRLLAILILTPIPCLLLITLIDLMPLEPLTTGLTQSYVFLIRAGSGVLLMVYGALIQYWQLIPALRSSSTQIIAMATFTALGMVSGALLIAPFTGYPIPFMTLLVGPIYMVFLLIAIVVGWGKLLKRDQRVRKELQQYQVVVGILFMLTLLYPGYNYVFSTISSSRQTWFALLLPVIKLAAKNAISPFCKYIEDYKPEALIFNVEIFHALFAAICMQNTTSIKTTLLLMGMDFVHAVLSLRDIQLVVNRIVILRTKIMDASKHRQEKTQADCTLASANINQVISHVLFLVKTDAAIHENSHIRVRSRNVVPLPSVRTITNHASRNAVGPAPESVSDRPGKESVTNEPQTVDRTGSKRQSCPQSMRLHRGSFGFDLSSIPDAVSVHEQHALTTALSPPERIEYVERTLQLMHMVVFMALVEYAEVIIPVIYSVYLNLIVRLPNHKYYVTLENLTTDNIAQAVSNILLYATLELASLVVLDVFLRRKLGFSPMRQLAYVLEKQWKLVQVKLCVWILFMIQFSLVHYGMDFSFNFDWNKNP